MSDLIKREDAIRELCRSSVYKWSVEEDQLAHNWAISIIESLPSADAEQGEWKFVDNEIFAGEYFCSICGKRAEVDLYGEWILSNFCPNCGAKMYREESEK